MGLLNYLADLLRNHKTIFLTLFLPSFAFAGVFYDKLNVDNIQIDGNTISTTNTDGDLTLDMNGTGSVIFTDLTATTVPYLDASKQLTSSVVTPTELALLSGVTGVLVTEDGTQILTNKSIDSDNNTITNIVNADVKSAAAIALNKLAAATASRALVSDVSGFIIPSTTTATEVGYLNGVTSALQTQLDAKIDDWSGVADNAVMRASGAGGDTLQESGVTITDADIINGVTQLNVDNIRIDGNDISSQDTNGDVTITPNGIGVVDVSGNLNLLAEGEIRLQDASGGEYMGFKSPATVTSSETFTLPDGDGTINQYLKTDGSGTLSWTSLAGAALTVSTETGTSFSASTGNLYLIDTTSNDVTANLPAASGEAGSTIIFKVINNTNSFIADGNASETVDGLTTFELNGDEEFIAITSDGSNWHVVQSQFTQLLSSEASPATYTTTAGQWGDATSLALTPALEWDCTAYIQYLTDGGGSSTATTVIAGINTVAGNVSAGDEGVDWVGTEKANTPGDKDLATFHKYGVIVTSDTTYYLKSRVINSITNIDFAYKFSCRRIK